MHENGSQKLQVHYLQTCQNMEMWIPYLVTAGTINFIIIADVDSIRGWLLFILHKLYIS